MRPILLAATLAVVAFAAVATPTVRAATPSALSKEQAASTAAKAQELLNAGEGEEAEKLLAPLVRGPSADTQLILLHSTALFLSGDNDAGRQELDRALKQDPTLRQGWLNRAALELVDKNYDAAYKDFTAAEKLDPAASDNALNLGAVLLLQGKLQAASARFQAYLAANPASSEAAYLVATNYAMAGYNSLATQNLKNAIALDERSRVRARVDGNFSALAKTPEFQQVLSTDSFVLSAGSYQVGETYVVQYETQHNKLLNAVLDSMTSAGLPFDPNVEVTADWALLWGELRVKVSRGPDGGRVELTAPAERMTPEQWRDRSQRLFREIGIHLVK